MGVRLICIVLLGFTVALWGMSTGLNDLNIAARIGLHIFYGGACLVYLYGIITGRAPG